MADVRAIEVWRPVHGLEDLFQVSNCGGVRGGTGPIAPVADSKGYRHVSLAGRGYTVHSLVLEAFICPRPYGLLGLHLDDVKWHNHVSNLYWGTPRDNGRDAVRNGVLGVHGSVKTHCPRGHILAEPNLVASGRGRMCKACNRARSFLRNRGIVRPSEDLMESTASKYYAKIMFADWCFAPA